jgi:hypothetical protein
VFGLTFAIGLICQAMVFEANAQIKYTIASLHPQGGLSGYATAINGLGDVVGVYLWKNGTIHS